MKRSFIWIGLWSLIGFSTSALATDSSSWTSADIYGGQIWSLAMNPYDPNVLLAGGIKTLYKSTDGAATWQPTSINNGLVTGIAFAPSNSSVAYVCAPGPNGFMGIGKSVDAGETWTRIATPKQFNKIVCSPLSADTLYTCDRQINPAHIYKSTNGGINWETVFTLPQDFSVSRLAMAGANVIVTANLNTDQDGAVFCWDETSGKWWEFTALVSEAMDRPVYSLAVDPDNSDKVYAGGRKYFFKSTDRGVSWTAVDVSTSLNTNSCRTVMLTVVSGNTLLACNAINLYRSTDAGENWALLGPVDPAFGGPMGELCDPVNDGTHVYLGDSNGYGIYKSTDGGTTFHEANTNIRGVRFLFLARSSIETHVVYAGSDVDFYRSYDSGQTWTRLIGLGGLRAGVGDMIVPPGAANAVMAYQQVKGSPQSAITRSDDYGDTWQSVYMLPSDAGGVLKFAYNPGNTTVVYAGVGGGIMSPRTNDGLYKSTDSGYSWSRIAFAGSVISNIAIDPGNTLTMYVGKGQFCQQKNAFTTGAYKTTDGGSTWTPMGVPADIISALVMDPDDAATVYIATISNGVFKSEDSGNTWVNIHTQWGISAFVIATTVEGEKALCFATDNGSIYVSADAGANWQLYTNGFDVINALCPGSLYAGTNTGLYKTELAISAVEPDPNATSTPNGTISNGPLVRAYPNPSRGQINFIFNLDVPKQAKLDIFNLQGERVAKLEDNLNDNSNVLIWNCRGVAPGIYIARIRLDGRAAAKLKVSVIK